MKTASFSYALLAGILFVFLGCTRGAPEALVAKDYRSWKTTHRIELNYPIPGHEDKYRRIYLNPQGENPEIKVQDGKLRYSYPEGTEVVKEIYEAGTFTGVGQPSSLTVMLKRPGHPQARAGWLWIVKDIPSGKETIISEEFCVTCHANANERHPYGDRNPTEDFRDFLFFPYPDLGGRN